MPILARPHVPEEELHAYCDGELSPSQRVEIAEHLLGCLICRSQYAEVEALRARASTLLAFAAPRQYGNPPMRQAGTPAVRRRTPRMMAAAVVALIGAGAWFALQSNDRALGPAQLATSLGVSGFFRLGRGDVDQAAIRARQLTMAGRLTELPKVQVGPAAPAFVPPVAIGTATEVDPVVASEWTVASVDDALRVVDGTLPHVSDIPVKLVRIHPSPLGGRPTLLIRQQLPDGHVVWVLEGLERDIAPVEPLLRASGMAMSAATRTRPDYVGIGVDAAVTTRMVRVVGFLSADSLNALAQRLVVR